MSNMVFDVNCLVGHWPFRKIYEGSIEALKAVHERNNVKYGFLASLDSIFYNDPFEGDMDLLEIAKKADMYPIMTVNPQLPGFDRDIDRAVTLGQIYGVRIYPALHDIDMAGEAMDTLAIKLKEYNLPLFISARMNARREDYMIIPPEPDVAAIASFINKYPKLTVLLLTFGANELYSEDFSDLIKSRDNIYFDVSWIRYTSLEILCSYFGASSMLYGSMHPLFCLESTLITLQKSHLSDSEKEAVLFNNAKQIFESIKIK